MLPAVRPRHVAWAELRRRTFALDVLACSDCGGRLRLVATIADPRVIAPILAHLGLPRSRRHWRRRASRAGWPRP
ncbi:MAG TPA: hypothetical protein VL049_18020, partial [Candidatus Dormibacteraeota bacterium]|nr:hypothetical protein [Candidatus Dormibacteraeota bacterium]